jgi:hypothetical protein
MNADEAAQPWLWLMFAITEFAARPRQENSGYEVQWAPTEARHNHQSVNVVLST